MAFPLKLASVLTGATPAQLAHWRETGLVIPEVRAKRPPLYSFRDLVLLRSVVFLRAQTSSQKVHRAFGNISQVVGLDDATDAVQHASRYRFGWDGDTIFIGTEDGRAVDLLKRVGQPMVFSFEDMLASFANFKQAAVPDFQRPGEHLEVRPGRLGGWPTIEGTRVGYDEVAQLVDYETVFPADVALYYPTVSAEAAIGAINFARRVEAVNA